MVEKTRKIEIESLIRGEHNNPHNILGMKEVRIHNDNFVIVRAFNPDARTVTWVDIKDENNRYEPEKIDSNGFFKITNK